MRKILLSILSFILVVSMLSAQAPKLAMVEEFTQASCSSCEALNPLIAPFLTTNTDKLVLLKYHTSPPGFDPINQQNPDDVQARFAFYEVEEIPTLYVDGIELFYDQNRGWEGHANDLEAIVTGGPTTSPLQINLTHTLSADLTKVDIRVEIRNVSSNMFDASNSVLQVAIVEEEINFDTPPGANNEVDFLMVMRKMLPSPNGTVLSNIAAGDAVVLEMNEVDVPSYIYNFNQINVVAFVQNQTTKAIRQAGISTPQSLSNYADVTAVSNTDTPDGLCDFEMTPSVSISNESTVDITSLELNYTINNGTPVVESWTGNLAIGQSDIISFPTLTLMPPTTVLDYEIVSVNGVRDINGLNNDIDQEVFFNLSLVPTRSEFEEGADITFFGEIPSGVLFANDPGTDLVLSALSTSFTDPPQPNLGGFGNSDGTFMFDFFNTNPGEQGILIFDKVDLSNSFGTKLTFSHAYAQFTVEKDRMEVLVSTDCGDTWKSVWGMSGVDLATTPEPVGGGLFYPLSSEWRANSIDLSAYDGSPDFVVGIRATSDFGNLGFVDDVILSSDLSSTYDVSKLDGKVEFFPNPVSDDLIISLQLEKATPVTAEVYDMAGKKVASIAQKTDFSVGKHILNWNVNDQANGMYMIRILTDEGEIARKISVLK